MEPGRNIEESHMRNRQMIAAWAFEQGKKENVISKISRLGKTYFQINDYTKLRAIFGNLLREIQRIKSQGDYTAARNLIENYGVIVDQRLLAEVKDRASKLNIPPYSGFIQPEYNLVYDKKGKAIDVEVRYPKDFTIQMLGYSKMFGYLPPRN
jgi:dipeptidyl-peptidase-3